MPYLKIQTNQPVNDTASPALLKKASRLVAGALNKPEEYVMVRLEPGGAMIFAGSAAPSAFLELRALALPVENTGKLSRLLCELVEAELGVPKDRVFINFTDVPANLWGWNGKTF